MLGWPSHRTKAADVVVACSAQKEDQESVDEGGGDSEYRKNTGMGSGGEELERGI